MVSDGIKNSWSFFDFCVLILIVMEHALGAKDVDSIDVVAKGLNPYCNGTCSRSFL